MRARDSLSLIRASTLAIACATSSANAPSRVSAPQGERVAVRARRDRAPQMAVDEDRRGDGGAHAARSDLRRKLPGKPS